MELEIRDFPRDEWNELVARFDGLSPIQTWEYAEAKRITGGWKVARAIFRNGDRIDGVAQCLLKRGLVRINRGPLCEDASLAAILTELKRYWAGNKKAFLLVAPVLADRARKDALLKATGFSSFSDRPSWSSAIIDLTGSEAAIRRELRQKWRNCLNRAEHAGLTCKFGNDEPLFAGFLSDYRRLLKEKRLRTGLTPEFLKVWQDLLPENSKLVVFEAIRGRERLGSILLAQYGRSVIYLCGAVSAAGKQINANYFLLWRAICEMKRSGRRAFDLGGMDEKLTPPGIFHFKAGLGGRPYQLVGEIEAHGRSLINSLIGLGLRIYAHANN
ncbi:MAG: GNAT family N-acetyltransferase [Desulfotomaculaceae bacterium]